MYIRSIAIFCNSVKGYFRATPQITGSKKQSDEAKKGRGGNCAFLVFQGQKLIEDQFLVSSSRPTHSGFVQPGILANLRNGDAVG